MERNVTKVISPAFMDRNRHVDPVRFIMKRVARLIDNGVEETFRDIQAMHQLRSFLNIGCDEWNMSLQLRITLAGRADGKIEQLVGGLTRIPLESDRAEIHERTFVDLEPQPIAILDLIVNARFREAVLAIKNFDEKRQIVRPGRSQAVTVDRGQLF